MTAKGNKVPFEKALDMTGYGVYNLSIFLLCSSIILGMTFEIFSVSYLVPASACELGTSSKQQGLMACVPLIGIIATSHFWGYLADTRGRRKILIISMTLSYIAGTAAAFSTNWIVLSFLKLLSSASVSGAFALSVTLLSECTPVAKRSSLVLLTTSVHLAGMGVMAVIALPVLPLKFAYYWPTIGIYFNSWRVLDLIFAVPCAVSAIGCYCAFESPKYLVTAGREEEALEVLKGIYTMNTRNSSDSYEVDSVELDEESSSSLHKGFWGSIAAQTLPMLKAPLLKNTILLASLFVVCYICMNGFFVWLPFIVNAFMISVVGGERHLTICEMIRMTANSTVVQEFVAGLSALIINSSPYWILSAILLLLFLSAILNFGFLNTFSVDVFPTYVKAMAVCVTVMVGRASAIIGINMIKLLLDYNCESVFYIFGTIAFVVCPVIVCAHAQPERSFVSLDHAHTHKPPCATCPRHGRCVPKVQCPAHRRPGAYNPLCELDGAVGVCCFTGLSHAAESDHLSRASASISPEDTKSSHSQSHKRLAHCMSKADKLLEHSAHTVLNTTAPSYGHHLSVVSLDKRAASIGPYCPPPPTCTAQSRYRSIGGECNNPTHSTWGAVHTGYERLLPPDYSDGTWAIRTARSGLPLPSARTVSSALLLDGTFPSRSHNLMFMQFGQFIAHDTSAGVVFTNNKDDAISCCTNNGEDILSPELQHFACAPIAVAPDDQFFSAFGHKCINFVRTQIAPADDCTVGYAKQMNGATHYPDLSHLYGSSQEKLSSLRAPGALLKTFNDYGRELPPLTKRKECMTVKEGAACFESGDHHGNQIISLTVLHTIFTREHNRIARALSRINPMWDEERVFWETRRILQAIHQHIIYNEWLPSLLGPQILKTFGLYPSSGYSTAYDPHVNPALSAEFSTAAMRFGHSVVDGRIMIPSPKMGGVYETISIPEVMFQPSRMRLRHFLDRLLIGLAAQPMQTVDPFVTEGLTRYMFHGGNPYGVDLAAINIQRGRDHGVRSYNHYRQLVGLPPYLEFQHFPPSAAQRLSLVYERPEDIDLWVGGLLEEPVEGGLLGPTFANIIADQFNRLKRGDRYFYEYGPDVNPGGFTPSQLEEIKKVTLSRLICDNNDGIELISQPPDAFLRADLPGNEPVPCDSSRIPSMDLNQFREI
ncbi:unnamed protein product [Chrysodeixis includens]|uniref:Major facilitator superfamily (MFS) profile domain-containing protein n=1 Tax=Chrysodeixis includens TaxID=689277 RepID=A0A9P0FSG3_CHRIL|nr:unnamed protein product [Chrysodeixis includens]